MRDRIRGLAAAVPLAFALAMALTGCGSGGDGGQVASADGGHTSGGPSPTASLSRDEMGVKFAQCMRENGVPMDDPEPGKGILLKVDGSISKATVDKATAACRKYQPQGQGPKGGDPKAADRMLKYVQCMRKNGVEAFPDPQPDGGIRIDGSVGQDPDFDSAQKKCQDIMGGDLSTEKKQ